MGKTPLGPNHHTRAHFSCVAQFTIWHARPTTGVRMVVLTQRAHRTATMWRSLLAPITHPLAPLAATNNRAPRALRSFHAGKIVGQGYELYPTSPL
jgi:hypothetical protein